MGGNNTDWVLIAKGEFESVGLVLVERVGVEDFDVHLPFFEVFGLDDCDSGGKVVFHLWSGGEVR